MVLVLAAVLLVLATAGGVLAARDWPLWNALRRVRPATPQRLAEAARDGRFDGRTVAVAGVAGAGPDGLLRSAVNDEPCVWHRHVVHRRRVTPGGTRYTRRRRVADVASTEPFVLRGADDPVIEVWPAGLRVHRPDAHRLRVLPGLATEPFPPAQDLMGAVGQMFWHREWVLRAGVPLFVLAEVRSRARPTEPAGSTGARLALRRPARGPHIVSTRTAGWLRARTALTVFGGLILAVAGLVAGALLLVARYG